MSRQGDFLIYCVETYKNAKHLTGRQVAELFTRYRVWDYVYSCFEALHTTGANYIVEDIDLYKRRDSPPQPDRIGYKRKPTGYLY